MIYMCYLPTPNILRTLPSRIKTTQSFSVFPILSKDHYESLGVSRNATQADIKAAYYKLSKVYHPDKNETPEAAETFRGITEAYEVIGNFKLRKMYDKGLLGHVADDGSKRSYTNYNPKSSYYKNQPSHQSRSNIYNFDEWSRFHYGDAFTRRQSAKVRYETKVRASAGSNTDGKHENVAFAMLTLFVVGYALSIRLRESYDDPDRSVPKKQ